MSTYQSGVRVQSCQQYPKHDNIRTATQHNNWFEELVLVIITHTRNRTRHVGPCCWDQRNSSEHLPKSNRVPQNVHHSTHYSDKIECNLQPVPHITKFHTDIKLQRKPSRPKEHNNHSPSTHNCHHHPACAVPLTLELRARSTNHQQSHRLICNTLRLIVCCHNCQ